MLQQVLIGSLSAQPLLQDRRSCRVPFKSQHRESVRCCSAADQNRADGDHRTASMQGRRETMRNIVFACAAAASALSAQQAQALGFQKDLKKSRRVNIPESEFKDGPEGLKFYDVKVGGGQTAKVGDRVAVHYEARWRGVTFMTSRQGMGVTGGSPIGFDVGTDPDYGTLKGLDLGVRGMKVGGQRKLILPPNLAYGDKGIGEIPPNSTLTLEVELLSIKNSPFGSRVKIVEG